MAVTRGLQQCPGPHLSEYYIFSTEGGSDIVLMWEAAEWQSNGGAGVHETATLWYCWKILDRDALVRWRLCNCQDPEQRYSFALMTDWQEQRSADT